eukprot:XP_011417389.1 PREDICTED: uncharacterized protein LOC105320942 [Crassostrea gigas]
MFLFKHHSIIDAYNCNHFIEGCPITSYRSQDVHKYQSCVTIANGCFLAEPKCIRGTEKQHLANNTTTTVYDSTEISQHEYTENANLVWKVTLPVIVVIILMICCILFIKIMKIKGTKPKPQPTNAFELDDIGANRTPLISNHLDAENNDDADSSRTRLISNHLTAEHNGMYNKNDPRKYFFEAWIIQIFNP